MKLATAIAALSTFAATAALAATATKCPEPVVIVHCFEPVDHGMNVYFQKEGETLVGRVTDVTFAEVKELARIPGATTVRLGGLLPLDAFGAVNLHTGDMLHLNVTEGNGNGETINWRGELTAVIGRELISKPGLYCRRFESTPPSK